jgi:uroporphyrinogen-III decarboxylase
MTQRKRFRDFVRGVSAERVLPFPIYKTACVASGLGRRWATDITLEESRDYMLKLGCVPSVTLGEKEWFPEGHPLSLAPRLTAEKAGRRDYAVGADTPFGDFRALFAEVERQSLTLVKSPAEKPEDYKKLLWYFQEVRKNTEAVRQQVETVRQRVGEECLIVFFLPQPYELYCLFSREEAIYLELDEPELFVELQTEILETVKAVIRPAVEGGADLLFFGSAGTELYSPELFERHLLPSSLEFARLIRAAGGLSTFHLCGCGKEYLDKGFFRDMEIDILEGLGTSETGNIPSVTYACERVPANLILRGNVPLDLLLNGTADEISAACGDILRQVNGRRHILSGECDILFGTPPENIRALAEAAANKKN